MVNLIGNTARESPLYVEIIVYTLALWIVHYVYRRFTVTVGNALNAVIIVRLSNACMHPIYYVMHYNFRSYLSATG